MPRSTRAADRHSISGLGDGRGEIKNFKLHCAALFVATAAAVITVVWASNNHHVGQNFKTHMGTSELFEFPAEFDQKLERGRADFDLLTSIARQQSLVFSPKIELFPPDLKFQFSATLPSVNTIISTTSLCQNQVEEFQKRLSVMPEAQVDDANEYNASSNDLVVKLKELSQEARALNVVYEADLRPWIASVQSPKMLELGPAANEALEKLVALKQLLQHLESIRRGHSELSKFRLRSDTQSVEATRLCHLTTECEAEVSELNGTNAVLRDSIAREREQRQRPLHQSPV